MYVFQQKTSHISETTKDRTKIAIDH